MKVHLIKKQTIEDYVAKHASGKSAFEDWLEKLKYANWKQPGDMKSTFNSADLLGKGCQRVVFDVGGNNYRVICKYVFGEKQVHLLICWRGTHAEYDKLCNANEQYTVNDF